MKEHEGTIYQVPLMALLSILVRDFGLGAEEKEEGAGFLASLSTEMKIED